MNLRIDRIKHLSVLICAARSFEEVSEYTDSFDAQDYSSKMFNMFSGDVCDVTLKCSLNLQEEILDRFGKKIPLTAVDLGHFETTVKTAVSDGLASWIMQYGADTEVLSLPRLRTMVSKKPPALHKYTPCRNNQPTVGTNCIRPQQTAPNQQTVVLSPV
ncbi:MAG: WYL domain-containing protein [Clostridiales bacterium]|nr:WYL domain-containing protein [Clostridiales bacterium]